MIRLNLKILSLKRFLLIFLWCEWVCYLPFIFFKDYTSTISCHFFGINFLVKNEQRLSCSALFLKNQFCALGAPYQSIYLRTENLAGLIHLRKYNFKMKSLNHVHSILLILYLRFAICYLVFRCFSENVKNHLPINSILDPLFCLIQVD